MASPDTATNPVSSVTDTPMIATGPENAEWTFVFAHGAGKGMDSAFMDAVSNRLAARGIRTVRFEFPYMAARRRGGVRKPPDRQEKLLGAFRSVLSAIRSAEAGKIAIGGKSMGGRMASILASESPGICDAVICLGYPFHPPGKPEKTRTDHLFRLDVPCLICQGTRDPFGNPDDVEGYNLPGNIRIQWIDDGDHDLKPRKSSGFTHDANLDAAVLAITEVVDKASACN